MDDSFFAVIIGFCVVALLVIMGFFLGRPHYAPDLEKALKELNRAHPLVINYMIEEDPTKDMKVWFYTIATAEDL